MMMSLRGSPQLLSIYTSLLQDSNTNGSRSLLRAMHVVLENLLQLLVITDDVCGSGDDRGASRLSIGVHQQSPQLGLIQISNLVRDCVGLIGSLDDDDIITGLSEEDGLLG